MATDRIAREREFVTLFSILSPADQAEMKALMAARIAFKRGEASPEQIARIDQARREISESQAVPA